MPEEQQYNRRATDKAHLDIRELILKTDSPKDKAMLLILLKISESLEANTSMTHEVSTKLDDHLDIFTEHEKQDAIKRAQIRTGWRVLSGILVLLQGVVMYAVKSHMDEARHMSTEINAIQTDVLVLKEQQKIIAQKGQR